MTGILIALGAGAFLFCAVVLLFGPHAQKKEKIQSRAGPFPTGSSSPFCADSPNCWAWSFPFRA